MKFAISATYGPTDPTRAELPFVFAASALQAGDSVTVILFHDAVHMATLKTAELIVPFGPPKRFEEVLSHSASKIIVCKPCYELRRLSNDDLDPRIEIGGMNDFHAVAASENARVVCF